jgi:diadenosine tetraphosphate (Ap4A) HIT family hydrolase
MFARKDWYVQRAEYQYARVHTVFVSDSTIERELSLQDQAGAYRLASDLKSLSRAMSQAECRWSCRHGVTRARISALVP